LKVWAIRTGNTLTAAADRALYVGELEATGMHRHAAPVLLIGLSGRFTLHGPAGRADCWSALVDIGIEHVFDPRGERVALIYVEPDAPEIRGLRGLLAARGGVLVDPVRRVRDRARTEARLGSFDLRELLSFGWPDAAPVDPRVQRSLQLLRAPGLAPSNRAAAAALAHLSESRFNHLFRAEMGVSFRSYRVWSQLRAAMTAIGPGMNLTHAAHLGSFSDSAHFSRVFRQSFGMTPSSVLKPLASVRLL
jgi:AraC-like DNA-binding protein